MLNYQPRIRNHHKYLSFDNATSKKLYEIFIKNDNRPVHEKTVQNWFNQELDWDGIYVSTAQLTRNAYLLQTQFKLTHNILPTNDKLYVWKVIERPHCICGVVDTNIHFVVQCKLIRPFWQKV